MPIRPKPIRLECPKCHWRGTVRPNSDAMLGKPEDIPCPECGYFPLDSECRAGVGGMKIDSRRTD